jgi:hypothetical protein
LSVEVTTDKARLDIALIHRFLADDSYWVRNISRADVEACIENSLCFGVYANLDSTCRRIRSVKWNWSSPARSREAGGVIMY